MVSFRWMGGWCLLGGWADGVFSPLHQISRLIESPILEAQHARQTSQIAPSLPRHQEPVPVVHHLPPGLRSRVFRVKGLGVRVCTPVVHHLPPEYGLTTRGLRFTWLPFKYDARFTV
jgi:hypothetical protein